MGNNSCKEKSMGQHIVHVKQHNVFNQEKVATEEERL